MAVACTPCCQFALRDSWSHVLPLEVPGSEAQSVDMPYAVLRDGHHVADSLST